MDAGDVTSLQGFSNLPLRLCELLVRRGLLAGAETVAFLRPSLDRLHPPGQLPDMTRAADRIEQAITAGEQILVHGDYDVDGMTGAAVLSGAFGDLGGMATAFVPHRTRHGYDLGAAGIAKAREIGATLIVTVDCGITAVEAVTEAATRGIDVVVTDHHRPGPALPPAVAVVNPNREDNEYPYRGLAGVGVAFKVIQELFSRQQVSNERLNGYLDLVALGTIADQAPLTGENRILTSFGLKVLDRTRRPGLRALMQTAGVGRWSTVRATDVAFRLAPRLNSAGRIAEAADGLRLLMTDDFAEADRLAGAIEETNTLRRETDRTIFEEARTALAADFDPERDRIAVLWGDGWHPGVLGIAASRLVDDLRRPAVLVSVNGDRARGSARSTPGFHLFNALASCDDLFDRFGGHAVAAGFDIRTDRLPELRRRLLEFAARELPLEALAPELTIDLDISLSEIAPAFVRGFQYLEPFGNSNEMPRFAARGVTFRRIETVGADGDHLKALLDQDGSTLEAISFWNGDKVPDLSASPVRDVVFELQVEVGSRGPRAQAHIVSISS
ncbi:MAG: single-stranded-DNA-specific exonuclease RecJ [Gemmatimonadota bacterium]